MVLTPSTRKKPLILVVDDDIHIADMLRQDLESEGYLVVVSTDGISAIKTACEIKPDLLVMDIFMPGQNGLETLETIHHRPGMDKLPVILMSGQISEGMASPQDPNARRFAMIKKPLHLNEFNRLVRTFIQPH